NPVTIRVSSLVTAHEISNNVVMRHICNIREKIEDDPGQPLYIQTVRGVGYRFNGNLGSE
ncbi:winged helix-turn-helix domain-containing protein, partial [Blautia luti]|uniref:winged helix-turn-helix domain-containing protein n=1 Tax=Blautia luti TaxID=89014 RepID=UPI00156D9CBD